MLCMKCGSEAVKGFTTVKKLENIIAKAKGLMQEISVIDYGKAA